ncbi:Hypothetical predicted protein, partial [Marmota monax]
QVATIEQSVNEKIRDQLPVSVQELSLDDPEVEKKNNLNLLRDLAVHIVHCLRNSPDRGGVVIQYRKEGDSEFMNIIASEIGRASGGCGNLRPRVAEVLEGKGAGKKGRFQGKATKMSQWAEVQELLQDYVSTQSTE